MKTDPSVPGRRRFLKQSALGLGVGVPTLLATTLTDVQFDAPVLSLEDQVIVFQGDSITDAGRSKNNQAPNRPSSLGNGYVGVTVAQLLGENPGSSWQCYNRGISGNKVFQLAERWQEDCLDLQPDILSILIGVNDFWHTLSHDYDGTAEVYEQDFKALLDRTRAALPEVTLLIGEPFVVEGGTALSDAWFPAFKAYQDAAREIAHDYDAVLIPYQALFNTALSTAPVAYWCPDGVHPAPAGNYLMAAAWLKALDRALKL